MSNTLLYPCSHLECHLELNFLRLLNGDIMSSTGSINLNKIATKLFGLKVLIFECTALKYCVFLNIGNHLGCCPYIVYFTALISMHN